ncbi:MAG: pyridoxamine 5'-phosphate oxidase [Cyclobacteriaceae bacterium]|jgi:pyridoxamine 5'-phosphate oxidase|nr:pyridoxamine 5'-phosphate oxidase [Flammeovirgaceae bacterium]MCZ8020240.1 pyridoxamine 5'-phosphate oxidase [Cytophagales bacterium]MCZ8327086.1 pyridoxamine 5'-phosphate oxidase [Cyclobacteriaceae bacterium]
MENLQNLRKEYAKASLDEKSVLQNPVKQFEKWFAEAMQANLPEPNAMCLATVSADGRPSQRIVLLKEIDNGDFVFYTNYQSKKGLHLAQNPVCSVTFFWHELERQVRIEGIAEKVSEEKSIAYFQSRPVGSQIGAWVSPQSTPIASRSILEDRLTKIEERFAGLQKLPKPQQWGGFAIRPLLIEFWQGRPNRLHDRIEYTRTDNDWKILRLAP